MQDTKNNNNNVKKKKIYGKTLGCLTILFTIAIIIIIGEILLPDVTNRILNVLWILIFVITVIFVGIGVLVVMGMKEEANKVLNAILEGTLKVVDVFNFFKLLYESFIRTMKDLLVHIAPIFAHLIGILIYIVLLVIYKFSGKYYDVTLLTVILTVFMISLIGYIYNTGTNTEHFNKWGKLISERFHKHLLISLELIIFIFFLTMDSTKLFFLPDHLNIEIHSKIGNYDMMKPAFLVDETFKTTLTIIILGIFVEMVRYILRIIAISIKYYRIFRKKEGTDSKTWGTIVKNSIRTAFYLTKENTISFVTITTALIIVFIIFPRLKLFTMLIASTTALILDLFVPSRLTLEERDDLVSKIFTKLFKLKH